MCGVVASYILATKRSQVRDTQSPGRSAPERFWGEVLTKRRYTNVRPLPLPLHNNGQVVHTHVPVFIKQYKLVHAQAGS